MNIWKIEKDNRIIMNDISLLIYIFLIDKKKIILIMIFMIFNDFKMMIIIIFYISLINDLEKWCKFMKINYFY